MAAPYATAYIPGSRPRTGFDLPKSPVPAPRSSRSPAIYASASVDVHSFVSSFFRKAPGPRLGDKMRDTI